LISRKEVGEYCTRVRELVLKLLEAISESLGLEREYVSQNLGKHDQHMAMNYYPPCPQPELTYGLPVLEKYFQNILKLTKHFYQSKSGYR